PEARGERDREGGGHDVHAPGAHEAAEGGAERARAVDRARGGGRGGGLGRGGGGAHDLAPFLARRRGAGWIAGRTGGSSVEARRGRGSKGTGIVAGAAPGTDGPKASAAPTIAVSPCASRRVAATRAPSPSPRCTASAICAYEVRSRCSL